MFISGLQKLTLLDYPGAVACTVFTAGCNFRCPFCHNASLVLPEELREDVDRDAVLRFLKKRQGVLEGVAVTGGEPLLHDELPDFLREVRTLGYKIKLDTNGYLPDRLSAVVGAGLVDRVAMDVKNSPALYARTAGVASLDIKAVERSKDFLLSDPVEYELRTTVVKGLHTQESLVDAAKWISGAREYYLQQFRPGDSMIDGDGLSAFDEAEMRALLAAVAPYVPSVRLRGL